VFQSFALFAPISVAQDIAFGLLMQGLERLGRDDFDLPTRSLQAWTVSTGRWRAVLADAK